MDRKLKRYTVFLDGSNSTEVEAYNFDAETIGGIFEVTFYDNEDKIIGYYADVVGVIER